MHDDEEEYPEFPWLMAIPATVWAAHGLFLLAAAVWSMFRPPDPYLGRDIDLCFATVFALAALPFLASGLAVYRGRTLTVIYFTLGLYFLIFAMLLPSGNDNMFYLAMDGIAMFGTLLITIIEFNAWQRWVEHRHGRPQQP